SSRAEREDSLSLARTAVGFSAILLSTRLIGCSSGSQTGAAGEDTGIAMLSIVKAPGDATCLQITVAGSRIVQNSFDLSPGQDAVFKLQGLPTGSVVFSEQAFGIACSLVNSSSVPTWLGGPVTVTLTPGVVANVTIVLRRNGQAIVTSDFQED